MIGAEAVKKCSKIDEQVWSYTQNFTSYFLHSLLKSEMTVPLSIRSQSTVYVLENSGQLSA